MASSNTLTRIETILSHVDGGAMVAGPDRVITQCGNRAAKLLRKDPGEIRGRPLERVLSESARLPPRVVLATLFRQPSRSLTWTCEGPQPAALRATAHAESNWHWIIVDDISERMRRANELNSLHFAVEQLRDSAVADDSVNALTHDLRNLMTILSLDLDRLTKTDERLGSLRALTDQALELVHALRPQRDTLVASGPMSLDAHLSASRLALEGCAGAEITLEFGSHAPSDTVVLAPSQLRSLLLNAVVNARQAGARRVAIETTPDNEGAACVGGFVLPPSPYVVLRVRDDGEGMDAETLARACDYRFTTRVGGSGTGLARIQRIARDAHGGITLRSMPGEGTELAVYFPRAEPEAD